MGKLIINLSLVNGQLYYQDSESHAGGTITSHVKADQIVEWTLAKNSGIKSITAITVTGTAGFFSSGPSQKTSSLWQAKIGKITQGEVSYTVSYEAVDSVSARSQTMSAAADEPPKIKLP